jgi:hypothetical protein
MTDTSGIIWVAAGCTLMNACNCFNRTLSAPEQHFSVLNEQGEEQTRLLRELKINHEIGRAGGDPNRLKYMRTEDAAFAAGPRGIPIPIRQTRHH